MSRRWVARSPGDLRDDDQGHGDRMDRWFRGRDQGNATVEFVAVVPLMLLVGFAVLQLALVAHAQSIVSVAAAEAARVAAVAGEPASTARQTAVDLVDEALGGVPLTDYQLTRTRVASATVVTVRLEARPQLTLLPDLAVVSGTGHALLEPTA